MITEGEYSSSYTRLPAPSAYGTLADLEVDIPNDNRTFNKIPYALIELAPLTEHLPIEFGGFTASIPPPPAVIIIPSSSGSSSVDIPSLSGTPFSFSGATGPSAPSNGIGCISPSIASPSFISPSFSPSFSVGP
jgi:hypothetical protein